VAFFLIYIQEAHSSDGWQTASNEKEHILFKDPESYDERAGLAATCSINLGIEFPALVDTIDNSAERAYTAWPDRLYVIDQQGRIAFKSDAGPFGFKAQGVADALDTLVKTEGATAKQE
jgi:type I thyroxine 5'-deiodinase